MKQKADISLLAIICVFLVLLCLEPLIKIPNHLIPTHFLTCALTILLFMGFSNPFVQSKTEIKSIKENKNFFVRLAIALALSAIILFVRMIIPLCFILEDNLESKKRKLFANTEEQSNVRIFVFWGKADKKLSAFRDSFQKRTMGMHDGWDG